MMWPSQNFLLYIRNIINMKANEWINNFKKITIESNTINSIASGEENNQLS